MIQEIKRLNVSKDAALTGERIGQLWKSMSVQSKTQLSDYGFTESSVLRSRSKGNISVKLAAVLSLISGCDPYFLTAETDENAPADEGRVREFIIAHGYEKVLGVAATPEPKKRKYERKATKNEGAPESKPKQPPTVIEEIILAAPPVREDTLSIQEFADIQIKKLTDTEKSSLNEMPVEDLMALLSALQCQVKYSDKAKILIGLIKLILVR